MKIKFLTPIFLAFILATNVSAQDYSAGIRISSLGFGADVARSFGENFNLHLGAAFFNLKMNGGGGSEDYTYEATAKLTSISLLLDYMPFENFFRITGGILLNLNSAVTEMTPTKTYTIGGDQYTPEKLGNLNADITFNKVAPYIGIGFGNPTGGESGVSISFDVGTMYQGAPKVALSAEGLLEPSAAPDQEQTLEDNLSWFKWYPALILGIHYKF